GGSWFRYAGNRQWSWQRDWFDLGNVTAVFVVMMKAGVLSDGMKRRLDRAASGEPIPGYYARRESPVPIWSARPLTGRTLPRRGGGAGREGRIWRAEGISAPP